MRTARQAPQQAPGSSPGPTNNRDTLVAPAMGQLRGSLGGLTSLVPNCLHFPEPERGLVPSVWNQGSPVTL